MAGKRRAYAVIVTCPIQKFNDTLCWDGNSRAIFGTQQAAVEFRDQLVIDANSTVDQYEIVKVELK